jgi:hypothetical protein
MNKFIKFCTKESALSELPRMQNYNLITGVHSADSEE